MTRDTLALAGPAGRIELSAAAVSSVVVRAAESVPGVRVRRPRRGLDITIGDTVAHVSVGVTGPPDGVLPAVGEAVQRSVAGVLGAMTSLAVTVDVTIEELA